MVRRATYLGCVIVGYVLLGLLATGATAALLFELFGSDGGSDGPSAPGDDEEVRLVSTEGADTLRGGAGDDTLLGLAGRDLLLGNAGADFISGGDDQDVLFGGAGDDVLQGANGHDILIGDRGADQLSGGLGDDVLVGVDIGTTNLATGDDLLTSLPDNDPDEGDTLSGGFGDDVLILGSADTGTGGEGDDEFLLGAWIDPARPAVIADFDAADDAITVAVAGDLTAAELLVRATATGDSEILLDGTVLAIVRGTASTLTAADVNLVQIDDGPNNGGAGSGDDTLIGTAAADTLFGFAGNDSLVGLEGEDTLMGGDGDDTLQAGPGDDVVLGRDGDDAMTGGTGSDLLRGGLGNDVIFDNFGADTLIGSGGDDLLASGAFFDGAALTLAAGGASLTDILTAIPEGLQDTDRADILSGQDGEDTLIGGRDDSLSGGEGRDTFVGGQWTLGSRAPVVTDFDLADDVIIYAARSALLADLSVTYQGEDATLRDNGQPVMIIQGVGTAFTLAQVQLQMLPAAV